MLTVVLGMAVLSVLVVFHEFGHFVVARSLGVRVERFSLGFGPILLSRRLRGVEFALSAFPLGGYVKMGGDDPRHRELLKPGDFFAAAWWRRVLIALAGPGANLVLAVLLSVILLWAGVRVLDFPSRVGTVTEGSLADSLGFAAGDLITAVEGRATASYRAVEQALGEVPAEADVITLAVERSTGTAEIRVHRRRLDDLFRGLEFPVPAVVGEVVTESPAYKAGIAVGDRIVAVGQEPVDNFAELQKIVSASPERGLVFTVARGDRQFEVVIIPYADGRGDKKIGRIGITPASAGTFLIRRGFSDAVVEGPVLALAATGRMLSQIGLLFSDVSNLHQLSGPVAIIQASGDAAKAGLDRLLEIAVQLSLALMVFNLLPIPILDGGMIVLSVVEAVRRRPAGERGLAFYQGIGLAVMGSLLAFVVVKDFWQILQRWIALGRVDAP